jgi:hypothetical protein
MKQRDYEKICRTIASLCDKLYLEISDKKQKQKFIRYALIFGNLSKIKLNEVSNEKSKDN